MMAVYALEADIRAANAVQPSWLCMKVRVKAQIPSLWKKTLLRISASASTFVQLSTSMYKRMFGNH